MYTKEQIIEELKRIAEFKGGKTISQDDFELKSTIPMSTVRFHLGSWERALQEAGLTAAPSSPFRRKNMIKSEPASTDDLLRDLVRLYQETKEMPSLSLIEERGRFEAAQYKKRWKSVSEAFLEARRKYGKPQKPKPGPEPISEPKSEPVLDLMETIPEHVLHPDSPAASPKIEPKKPEKDSDDMENPMVMAGLDLGMDEPQPDDDMEILEDPNEITDDSRIIKAPKVPWENQVHTPPDEPMELGGMEFIQETIVSEPDDFALPRHSLLPPQQPDRHIYEPPENDVKQPIGMGNHKELNGGNLSGAGIQTAKINEITKQESPITQPTLNEPQMNKPEINEPFSAESIHPGPDVHDIKKPVQDIPNKTEEDELDIYDHNQNTPAAPQRKIAFIPKTIKPRHAKKTTRVSGDPLTFRGLRFAPADKQGVIFLFGMVSHELGFVVEAMMTEPPDAQGKRCLEETSRHWEQVRIHFEFKSSDFKNSGLNEDQVDIIVCWLHDWDDSPLEILELRSTLEYLNS